jgi:branched-subunit amino acid transport protein
MTSLWITITIIGAATYATRVVPLFWLRSNGQKQYRSSWLDRLGPCLLAAMAIAVIQPTFAHSEGALEMLSATSGLMAAGGSMWFRQDPGLATLVGMIAFYVVSGV